MAITLLILAGSAVFFMSGRVRSDLVAICALLLLLLSGILEPAEALSGFSNSVVIMMIGLFIVGGGIFQTGLAKMISSRLLKLAGNSELKMFLVVMLATAFIGAFVSNTGTVALMLPIVVSMATSANMNPARLLMPLAFASSMGGMLTLIGTPPNLVIQDALIAAGFERLSFFSFTPVGLIVLAAGIILLSLLTRLLGTKRDEHDEAGHGNRSLKELAGEYQISQNLFRVRVKERSSLNGHKLAELDIPERFNISIIEVRRKTSHKNPFFKTLSQQFAGPDTLIAEGDILYVLGDFAQVKHFACKSGLQLMDATTREQDTSSAGSNTLSFQEIGIAEVLLTPTSILLNKYIKDSGFRERYNVNILGIKRKGEYKLRQLKDERIRIGDALLVQGTWSNIARLEREQSDLVVVGQPLQEAAKVTLDHKAPIAAGIMLLMVALMVLDLFPAVVSVMLAAVLMIITGCLRNMEQAYKTINWESIVLIAGMIPMSAALEKTGAASLLSGGLVGGLGSLGPLALLAGVYFTTSLMTMFISNTATAVLLAPIALAAAADIGASPYPFLFAVTIGASLCFASPFSTPPNALVMAAGKYTFMDYIKVGLPLQIIIGVLMIMVLPLLFPF
ncbi:SLC13 family permease [Paenibacillus sp. SYP-B4298]|uniref:SLC13 family permease n=1 Tax=Paenibacillus sp. SYP-B4298 TaxID=2996034 RepID=UPI0022DDB637|nr:SLC13 family permease [Paenibacillus sp. SYP-B4298]